MSAIDPYKMTLYRELLKRRNELAPDEQELLGQVGRKLAAQAGGDPTGKGVDDAYPRVNRAMTTGLGDLNQMANAVRHPLDTLGAMADRGAEARRSGTHGSMAKDLVGPTLERIKAGQLPEAIGGVGALGLSTMIPGAASRGTSAGLTAIADSSIPSRMMSGSASARAAVSNVNARFPLGKADAAVQAAKTVARPVVNAAANVTERTAKILAGKPKPATLTFPATDDPLPTNAMMQRTDVPPLSADVKRGAPVAPPQSAPVGIQRPVSRDAMGRSTESFVEQLRQTETPEQTFARQQAQRNVEFQPETSSRSPVGVSRPSVNPLVESELQRLRKVETPEQLYARQQQLRNTEFQPDPSIDRRIGGVQRPTTQQVIGTPATITGIAPEINRWIGVKPAKMMRGADPGSRFVKDGVFNPDKDLMAANIEKAIPAVEAQMDSLLQAATKKGIKIKGDTIVTENLMNIRKLLGTPREATFDANISGLLDDIVNAHPNIDMMSPTQAQALKVHLGKSIKWTGQAAETPINKAMIEMYHDLNDAIKTGVPGIGPVQQRWGDYFIGTKSIQESIVRDAAGTGTGKLFKPRK